MREQGDKGTRTQGDKGTREQGDMEAIVSQMSPFLKCLKNILNIYKVYLKK